MRCYAWRLLIWVVSIAVDLFERGELGCIYLVFGWVLMPGYFGCE